MTFQMAIGAVIGAVATVFLMMTGLAFIEPGQYGLPAPLYGLLKDIVGPVAAGFGGAISGAFVSYRYQQAAESKAETKREVSAYNRALNILAAKLNDVGSLKKVMIIPHESHPLRFITMPATTGSSAVTSSALDQIEEVLLALGEHKLYMDINLAEATYVSVHDSVDARGRILEVHRSRSDSAESRQRRALTLSEIADVQGVASLVRLYNYTEEIIRIIDDCIDRLSTVLASLEEKCTPTLKKKGLKIVSYSRIESAPIYKRTEPPKIKNVEHLISLIQESVPVRGLASDTWSPSYMYSKGFTLRITLGR